MSNAVLPPAPAPGGGEPPAWRGLWLPLAIVALLVAGVVAAWAAHVARDREADYWAMLDAVAVLKSQQLAEWLHERRRSATIIATSEFLPGLYAEWRDGGDLAARNRLVQRLEELAATGRFSAVLLLDSAGTRLWHSPGAGEHVSVEASARYLGEARPGAVGLAGPYLDDAGEIHLDFVAGLFAPDGRLRAVVVLHTGEEDYLPPRLREFPAPVPSGEVAVFRRVGAEVVALSSLRHAPGSALRLRLPVNGEERPGVRVIGRQADGLERVKAADYRGVRVLKSRLPVAGTDWYLLAQVDRGDVLADVMHSVLWVALLGTLVLLGVGGGIGFRRQQLRLAALHGAQQAQAARLQSLELLEAVADNSPDPIFVKDTEGRYLMVNRAAADFLGRPVAEVVGRADDELFPAGQAERLRAIDRRVLAQGVLVTEQERLDSSTGPRLVVSTKGPVHDADGRVLGVYGIARDVTRQEEANRELEQRSHELAERNAQLQRFNEAMVGRELDMMRLKHEVNELSAELGRPRPYGREVLRESRP